LTYLGRFTKTGRVVDQALRRRMALREGRQERKVAEVSTQGHQGNRLLAALPQDAFAAMSRELRQVSLAQGKSRRMKSIFRKAE
jgi:hypothetical protein